MKLAIPGEPHRRAAWAAVAVAGLVALTSSWLGAWRSRVIEPSTQLALIVTTGTDDGPGSLRQAILDADRADGAVRITIQVRRIVLESPLPPLVNPKGVFVTAPAETELDASRIKGAALDVASPHTTLHRLRITKAQTAVVVRAANVTFDEVRIEDAGVGVLAGAGADGVTVDGSAFRGNRIGIQNADGGRTRITASRFQDHKTAGVWAVANRAAAGGTEVVVLDSRFVNDAIGIILAKRVSRVELNEFDGIHDVAVLASDGRIVARGNRIRSGRGSGLLLERVTGSLIDRNEIAHNCASGLTVRHAATTEVTANELYTNGIGIVILEGNTRTPNTISDNLVMNNQQDGLLLLGSSPLVRQNRLLDNRHAGLRVSQLLRNGSRLAASPRLDRNLLRGNGQDDPIRDSFDASPRPAKAKRPVDCAWRSPGAVEGGTERGR